MADWADVERIALGLPGSAESTTLGDACFKVRGKTFVWRRPLRVKDRRELGAAAPNGPVIGVRVAGEAGRSAVLAEFGTAFTISHFDNYPAVLVDLSPTGREDLDELVIQAWRCQAPAALRRVFDSAGSSDR